MIAQHRSKRKATGGRYHKMFRKKKLCENGREAILTKLSDKTKINEIRTRSGIIKRPILTTNIANVADPKTGKFTKTTIKTVVENKANRHYVRRNIITKNAVIMTEIGKARVTSRPGQDGMINAVLID